MEKFVPSTKWNFDFLKAKSYLTDPKAEQVIQSIVVGNDFKELRTLFMKLNDNDDQAKGNDLNQVVYDYFNQDQDLPAWADEQKIKLAQDVYRRYGMQVSLILNFYALPLCYSCKNGAKVLAATGRLTGTHQEVGRTFRRLFETSRIVMDTMAEGGLSPNGAGIVTAKKVRLYHTAIRYFLQHEQYNPIGWDVEELGAPINQEEMAGTLMSFSALVVNGLELLGSQLTSEEKDAYIHLWNIVGYFMGLDEDLLPDSYEDGWNLGLSIIARNNHSSPECKLLANSLIDFAEHIFKGTKMENMVLTTMPYYLIHYFTTPVAKTLHVDFMEMLGLTKKLTWFDRLKGKIFISIIKGLTKFEHKSKWFRKLYAKISQRYLKKMVDFYLKTYHADFYIPDSLKASWQMNG